MKYLSYIIQLTLIIVCLPLSKTIAQTIEVGTLPGTVGISPSGAATYSVPLDFPPGRAGMEPQLTFVYSNQAPSNIMGQGWGISGFSSIGRVNPTHYYNGTVDNVDFVDDQLILDGVRLIKIDSVEGNIIYRTEVDAIAKVVYHPTGAYGDYFEVYSKNGMIKEYGNSTNSRQIYVNSDNPSISGETPLIWHLNKISDRDGNSVKYFYERTTADGELHPDRIEYTHFSEPSEGFSYTVEFQYQSLPHESMYQTFYYENGGNAYLNKNNKRLDKIAVYDNSSTPIEIKSYQLNYLHTQEEHFAGEYFLESITLSANDITSKETASIKPTTFTWSIYQPQWTKNDIEFTFSAGGTFHPRSAYRISSLDINGDGKSEIVDYKEEYVENKDPIMKLIIHRFDIGTTLEITVASRIMYIGAADFNNDGRDELITRDFKGKVLIHNFIFKNGEWQSDENIISVTPGIEGSELIPYPGDYNADGKLDLLIVNNQNSINKAKLHIGTGNLASLFEPKTFEFDYSQVSSELRNIYGVADFNGDGQTDIAVEERINYENEQNEITKIVYKIHTYEFNGTGFIGLSIIPAEFENNNPSELDDNIYYVDLNGDGRFDIHHQMYPDHNTAGDEYNISFHSFGKGFSKITYTKINHDSASPALYITDVNNDGRADWVYFEVKEYGNPFEGYRIHTKTFYGHPNGLKKSFVKKDCYMTVYPRPLGNLAGLTFADISGNGILDIATSFYLTITDGADKPPSRYDFTLYAIQDDEKIASNVIGQIINGLGIESVIDYQSSINSFSGFSDLEYPIGPLKSKSYNIKETYLVDGQKKLAWKHFRFVTPKVMLTGKGFLGYEYIKMTDFQGGTITENHYNIHTKKINGKAYYYLPYVDSSIISTINSPHSCLVQTINKLDIKQTISNNNFVFIPIVSSSTSKHRDADGSFIKTVRRVQNTRDIDNYGNSLLSKVLSDEGQPQADDDFKYSVTVEAKYSGLIDIQNWLVGRPEYIKTTRKQRNENNNIKKTSYKYKTASTQILSRSYLPNNNRLLEHRLNYNYDNYGNVTRRTESAPGFSFNGSSLDDRVTHFTYEEGEEYKARFLTEVEKTIGSLSFKSSLIYDPIIGKLETSTSPDNLSSQLFYTVLGRTKKAINPDGTALHSVVEWNCGHNFAPTHETAAYYIYTYVTGAGGSPFAQMKGYNFYDRLGRLLRHVTFGLANEAIYTDYHYLGNEKGLLEKISEPYFNWQTSSLFTSYKYDDLNRITSTVLENGNIIHYTYSGLLIRTRNNGTMVETDKVLDALGRTVSVIDPTGKITYNYFSSGKLKQVYSLGAITKMSYDDAGRQATLIEPNSGQISYIYNPYGELMQQVNAKNDTIQMRYDALGRINEKTFTNANRTTRFLYNDVQPTEGAPGHGFGKLEQVTGANGFEYQYYYDGLSRLETQVEIHPGFNGGQLEYFGHYTYDSDMGRLKTYRFPKEFTLNYEYAVNGMLWKVSESGQTMNVLWENRAVDQRGQITEYKLGNGLTTQKSYDQFGLPTEIVTGSVQHLAYDFDITTGNLNWRADSIYNLVESFTYDDILKSRLTSWTVNGQQAYFTNYHNNGNIKQKSDVTNHDIPTSLYQYGTGARPHAVTGITEPNNDYLNDVVTENISYTEFNKISQITHFIGDQTKTLNIQYGPDEARKVTVYSESSGPQPVKEGAVKKIKHFVMGNYEVEIDERGNERLLHYLNGADGIFAIHVVNGENDTTYYVHKDYLGSFESITDEKGNVKDKLNFDPWGRRRNPLNWTYSKSPWPNLFDRGFTGHEHINQFKLINMNGRVYDPRLGRFLSPDPIVQAPENSQSYNRYSYVFNNPLKYTDPSGYEGGRFGPPANYAYGEGSARAGLNWRMNVNNRGVYLTSGSPLFSNNGFAFPGSGKHWSDQNRSEFGNFMIMSGKDFDGIYGKGSAEIVNIMRKFPEVYEKWKAGDITLKDVHDDDGFWVKIVRINTFTFSTGDESKQLEEVEIIYKWISVANSSGGDYIVQGGNKVEWDDVKTGFSWGNNSQTFKNKLSAKETVELLKSKANGHSALGFGGGATITVAASITKGFTWPYVVLDVAFGYSQYRIAGDYNDASWEVNSKLSNHPGYYHISTTSFNNQGQSRGGVDRFYNQGTGQFEFLIQY